MKACGTGTSPPATACRKKNNLLELPPPSSAPLAARASFSASALEDLTPCRQSVPSRVMTCQAHATLVVRLNVVVVAAMGTGSSRLGRARIAFDRARVERISQLPGCLDTVRAPRLDEAVPGGAPSPCLLARAALSQSDGAGSFPDDCPAPIFHDRRNPDWARRHPGFRRSAISAMSIRPSAMQGRNMHNRNGLPFLVHAPRNAVTMATCRQFARSGELAANAHTRLISRNERRFQGCPRVHCIRFEVQSLVFKDEARETAPFPETLGASQDNENQMNRTCCQWRHQ